MIASILLLAMVAQVTVAFAPSETRQWPIQSSTTSLFGLLEWREVQETREMSRLLLLPYRESDILLPGQASQVVLKEGRHFDMVDEALEEHQSIIGQAVMGEDKLSSTLSLCHITDADVNSGYRGKITMTISLESVGKATLEELLAMKPVPQGYCSEVNEDWTNQELDKLLRLQKDVESTIFQLDALSPNDKTPAFHNRYEGALLALRKSQTTSSVDRDGIEASSWAVFAALSAMEGSFDPRQALESATAMDRLIYGLGRANEIRATKQRQADQYSLLDEGVFE